MSNNNTDKAKRYNKGKPDYSLIDYKSLEPLVRALENGAAKYGRDDWKKGMSIETSLASMLRHIHKFSDGEDIDSESGVHHIGHVMANAMFIIYETNNNRNTEVYCVACSSLSIVEKLYKCSKCNDHVCEY